MTAALDDREAVVTDELDVFLDGDDCDPIEAPENLEQVDRLMGRLARIQGEKSEFEAYAKQRALQIGEWLAGRTAVLDNEIERMKALIGAHHEAVLAADSSKKTISLPNGTSKSRATPERVEIAEGADADVLGWCQRHRPDLVRKTVREAPDRKAIAEELRVAETGAGVVVVDPSTGEPVPGLVVRPAGRTFAVLVTPLPQLEEHGE
jgi:phage host-nuclease inhibitor protein Gam